MAKNSKRLDKSKNCNKINHTNENQLVELELDELEFVVGGNDPQDQANGDDNRPNYSPPPSREIN
ncbi:hypothetical protein [Dapis sp. BLCC M229]|uniref:hypothetical protein n=1 Tax=Dapis sp. BLCC M229 TaxID=3400188 RepID=UPI003CF68840